MKKKAISALLVTATIATLVGCGDSNDASQLSFNLAYGNMYRTMTYQFTDTLVLPDGTAVRNGNLKPVWQQLQTEMGVTFKDNTTQAQASTTMISLEASQSFKNSNIYGGNGIAEDLMNYGTQGMFVPLNDYFDQMEYFPTYLENNPTIEKYITAYDGNIYHVPYVSEIGETARTYNMRTDWVEDLLNRSATAGLDTDSASEHLGTYTAFYNESSNPRATTVYPQATVGITKKTTQNIIDLQNGVKSSATGATLAAQLTQYIKDNYNYTNPSELYVGANAAYDIDELVALYRVIKANEGYLAEEYASSVSTTVWPFFVRQSSYREDILRFATYFGGVAMYGSDSYSSRWVFDENGQIQYTYNSTETYAVLLKLQEMYAEGLIHSDFYDSTDSSNFRQQLYGNDNVAGTELGFMSYDWIASSTASSLNSSVNVVLPPVAEVNGVWQYYIDNSRTIKPDGWAISVNGSNDAQIKKAVELFDYMFSPEGSQLQNYGMDQLLEDGQNWESDDFDLPEGVEYPVFKDWVTSTSNDLADGDLSVFLRDYIGALMPIGFAKEIGFEYQYTSDRGFAGIDMLDNSTVGYPSYEGTGKAGTNSNYYTLVPPTFSMTKIEQDAVKTNTVSEDRFELLFNIIRKQTNATYYVSSASAYTAFFDNLGIQTYIEAYQQAYTNMKKDWA